jgi:hypothetical protein
LRCGPLALVIWVILHWCLPFATARSFRAFGVWNLRSNPITIFFIIPVLWLLSLWIRNHGRLVIKPILWFGGLFIRNFEWSILIPIFRLLGLWISDTSFINPVFWLLIFRIINFLGWVDRRGKVLKKTASALFFTINVYGISVVGVDNKCIESGELGGANHWWVVKMLLLVLASLGILVTEDEMNLGKELGKI